MLNITVNLYLVKRDTLTDDAGTWDTNLAHVVAARSEQSARVFASELARDEGPFVWFAPTTTVTLVGKADKATDEGRVLTEDHCS